MGDRVGIQFVKNSNTSVVLFSHWGGIYFVEMAAEYIKQLKIDMIKEKGTFIGAGPLGRLEPDTVMVDFIRHVTKNMDRVTNDLYLGKDESDGDASDNGVWQINLEGDIPPERT